MFYEGTDRHYLTVSTPGARDTDSVRTEADTAQAIRYIANAKRVIQSQEPLDKLSNDPTYFECRFCAFSGVCHGGDMPERNCRTCTHSETIANGEWMCQRFGHKLNLDQQIAGCPAHIYLKGLVPGDVMAADDKSITYRLRGSGATWVDSEVK